MKKLFRSKKALSPVVAAIILIAVTVAVSIAVAAWMGALTFSFMGGAEELNILSVTYDETNKQVKIKVTNSGSGTITISDIEIDGTTYKDFNSTNNGSVSPSLPDDLDKGETETYTITFTTWPFQSGVKYEFTVITAKGHQFSYQKTAPY
ncbi:hypothetical protein J7K06_07870 [Candidatus Bathyarchaeota archaeon]|nr:hypothetical protein [Candidatus Bathyarchaeota archaeon]